MELLINRVDKPSDSCSQSLEDLDHNEVEWTLAPVTAGQQNSETTDVLHRGRKAKTSYLQPTDEAEKT